MLLTQGYFGIGIVEDNIDPQGLGRVRVRIFDIHGSDKLKIPTDSLPWANVLHAANYSSHFERIKENTYLCRKFFENSQLRYMGLYWI